MTNLPVSVGLDYHSEFVQVCVVDNDGKLLANRKVANCAVAIANAVNRFGGPTSAALEACCGAANLADELAARTDWQIQLAHPGYVARMKGSPDKTDFSDARLLADLVRVGYLPVVWLAPEKIRELRRLVRFRNQLVKQRRNAKLRIRAFLRDQRLRPAGLNPWTKAWVRWLNEQSFSENDRWMLDQWLDDVRTLTLRIRATEGRLRQTTKDDAVVAKLLSLFGVGLVTAVTLRAEVGRFDRFNNGKQLARFCCVTPRNVSSGNRQADSGLIRAGSPLLRTVIMETAHRLSWQLDSRWAELVSRLTSRGKPKNVAIAALANRWVRWLHHQLTTEALAT